MKRTGLSLFLLGLLSLALILVACAPSVPHSVEVRKECITCHGSDGVKPYPTWHAKRGYKNGDCTSCHDAKTNDRNVAGATAR